MNTCCICFSACNYRGNAFQLEAIIKQRIRDQYIEELTKERDALSLELYRNTITDEELKEKNAERQEKLRLVESEKSEIQLNVKELKRKLERAKLLLPQGSNQHFHYSSSSYRRMLTTWEHLEAAIQQNQQLQAQLSLMALAGEGDGLDREEVEEEEAPGPMPSISEELKSQEAMVELVFPLVSDRNQGHGGLQAAAQNPADESAPGTPGPQELGAADKQGAHKTTEYIILYMVSLLKNVQHRQFFLQHCNRLLFLWVTTGNSKVLQGDSVKSTYFIKKHFKINLKIGSCVAQPGQNS
ncbi:golgin subfamily A member 2 isoform X2 [Piliocolobus tephrosceles]|uniref:golgin subfamily A member 2 isoform X2 n=1 Tax=Piliocolobus tephrosceles TaxID=591936 RepID=UPI000E6AF89E|nr:golgin subfamily A member 2 isoform X2 [Piliocolobus tephrosceles]